MRSSVFKNNDFPSMYKAPYRAQQSPEEIILILALFSPEQKQQSHQKIAEYLKRTVFSFEREHKQQKSL